MGENADSRADKVLGARLRVILDRLDKRSADEAQRLAEINVLIASMRWKEATKDSSIFLKHETGLFPSIR